MRPHFEGVFYGVFMTKTDFEKLLLKEGYLCEANASYPSVIVDEKRAVRSVYRKVKARAKELGYSSSFAVRVKRAGMNIVGNPAAASDEVFAEKGAEMPVLDAAVEEKKPFVNDIADETIDVQVADTTPSLEETSAFKFDFFKDFGNIGA